MRVYFRKGLHIWAPSTIRPYKPATLEAEKMTVENFMGRKQRVICLLTFKKEACMPSELRKSRHGKTTRKYHQAGIKKHSNASTSIIMAERPCIQMEANQVSTIFGRKMGKTLGHIQYNTSKTHITLQFKTTIINGNKKNILPCDKSSTISINLSEEDSGEEWWQLANLLSYWFKFWYAKDKITNKFLDYQTRKHSSRYTHHAPEVHPDNHKRTAEL